MAKDFLSGPDSTWLVLEWPNSIFSCGGVYTLDRRLSRAEGLIYTADMARFFGDRYLKRFVKDQRPGGRPYFEHDPNFAVENHYEFQDLGVSATYDDLLSNVLGEWLYEYHPDRPLWGVKLFHFGDNECGLAAKFHHVIADGQVQVKFKSIR